jgi:predicted enzyme related to lactoylglutathione lyase
MITGVHALLYSTEPEALRAFVRDVLQLPSVDAGRGWLIFALPPAELGVHPSEDENAPELYLMCDDVHKTIEELRARGAVFVRPVAEQGFGLVTAIRLPGGGELGLYQPKHPTALSLTSDRPAAAP